MWPETFFSFFGPRDHKIAHHRRKRILLESQQATVNFGKAAA